MTTLLCPGQYNQMNVVPKVVRRRPITLLLVLCVLALALFAIRNLATIDKDPTFVAIRQAGYPVTLQELDDFYSPVPENENAALLYQQAFSLGLFTNNPPDLTSNFSLARGKPMPEKDRAILFGFLATNAAAWELFYSATNRPGSRYSLDMRQGAQVSLTNLPHVKATTTLLSLEALAHASNGESNQTYAALNAAASAADSIREEPLLISFLVRIACSAIVAKRVEQCLNLVPLDEGQLRSLQERFAAVDDPRWAARALAGERAAGISYFMDPQAQRSLLTQPGASGTPNALAAQLAFAAYRMSGLMRKDRNFYLGVMATNVSRAEMSADERIKTGPAPVISITNRLLVLSRILLPALQRTLDRADENAARMRVVQTGLAVERWRVSHAGKLPDSLEQLAPQYLHKVPLDPFDSHPLRYKKLPRGYVVYSIGADQKDDGGAEPPPPDKAGKRTKSIAPDVTFVVERQ